MNKFQLTLDMSLEDKVTKAEFSGTIMATVKVSLDFAQTHILSTKLWIFSTDSTFPRETYSPI